MHGHHRVQVGTKNLTFSVFTMNNYTHVQDRPCKRSVSSNGATAIGFATGHSTFITASEIPADPNEKH